MRKKPKDRKRLDAFLRVRVPARLLAEVDSIACETYCPRSQAVRRLLARAVKASKNPDFLEA